MATRALAIFDVCDTLYAANTTVAYLDHLASSGDHPAVARAIDRWTSRRSPSFWVGAVAHRLLGWDVARERLVASLRGEARDTLEAAARDFAANVLPALVNAPLIDQLEAHRAAGDRVMLVSSSLDVVIAAIASRLGAEFAASTLGFRNGRSTGKIIRDVTGKKDDIVRDLDGVKPSHLVVYTDNRTDLALVRLADRATIVIPHGRRDEQWGGADVDTIRL